MSNWSASHVKGLCLSERKWLWGQLQNGRQEVGRTAGFILLPWRWLLRDVAIGRLVSRGWQIINKRPDDRRWIFVPRVKWEWKWASTSPIETHWLTQEAHICHLRYHVTPHTKYSVDDEKNSLWTKRSFLLMMTRNLLKWTPWYLDHAPVDTNLSIQVMCSFLPQNKRRWAYLECWAGTL